LPHPILHLSLAKTLADQLTLADIQADRGAFFLGSTAPDMRLVTHVDRSQTHFFQLNNFEHQDSVATMFETYPELRDRAKLNAPTASFLSGYMTHLILDEGWISEVYRPLFGERSPLKNTRRANVMDRVMQFELDRQRREDCETLDQIRADVASTALEVLVGFLDQESLQRWRELNVGFLKVPPTWERFRVVADMHLREYGISTPEEVDALMAEVPVILQEAIDYVGWDRIKHFIETAARRSRTQIKEFLA